MSGVIQLPGVRFQVSGKKNKKLKPETSGFNIGKAIKLGPGPKN
jgi:hypothetical protein